MSPGGPEPAGRGAPTASPELSARFAAPLPRSFYDRPTAAVARDLLGCWLVRERLRAPIAARLVETEAYVAGDPANHAYRGLTERNRSMFGAPGTLYVYRIHQVHCLNAVTRPGQAVLLRAAEAMEAGVGSTTGPGRLARAFGLTRAHDGLDLVEGPVRILPRTQRSLRIVRGPRVGISQARERPLRFLLRDSPAVSRPRPPAARKP